ncbi:MAG: hypothetical protein JJU13_20545 [Balneolaceae bacterium]|nr:hypothetical protein [Balneolaceae bacterium]
MIRIKTVSSFLILSLLLLFQTFVNAFAKDVKDNIKLISKIDLKELTGSEWWNEVRLGDLTGDNNLDMVVAAQRPDHRQHVGTLIAMDIEGNILWEVDLPDHSDGVAIADLNGNGELEIAVATCNGATFNVLDIHGNIQWTRPTDHAQHIVVGNFRPDVTTYEVAGLNRGTDRSLQGQDQIKVFSYDGDELWREERTDEGPERWLSIISRMSNWDQEDRDLILAYRRGADRKPELRDGYGNTIAQFPFPDLSLPNRAQRAQHADITGDPRSEILIWNARWIYIYGNAEEYVGDYDEPDRSIPYTRLYNYTHYIGMP